MVFVHPRTIWMPAVWSGALRRQRWATRTSWGIHDLHHSAPQRILGDQPEVQVDTRMARKAGRRTAEDLDRFRYVQWSAQDEGSRYGEKDRVPAFDGIRLLDDVAQATVKEVERRSDRNRPPHVLPPTEGSRRRWGRSAGCQTSASEQQGAVVRRNRTAPATSQPPLATRRKRPKGGPDAF